MQARQAMRRAWPRAREGAEMMDTVGNGMAVRFFKDGRVRRAAWHVRAPHQFVLVCVIGPWLRRAEGIVMHVCLASLCEQMRA